MKRLLLLFMPIALALPAASLAAEPIAYEDVAPTANAAVPVGVWSGPYAGAFVGYNTSNYDGAGGADFNGDGVVGGVYGGINFEAGPIVYGVEADIGASGVDGSGATSLATAPVEADQNVFGSLRARVGVNADPFLVFGTAGVAVSDNELSVGGASDTQTSVGYTVGAGVEAKITDNVTSRLEYRYSDFGDERYDIGKTVVSSGFDEHSIRAGVALKF